MGFGQWRSISEGRTLPGTPVTAVLDGDQFQVFATDPSGSVYTARGSEHAGWSPWRSVSEGQAHPGTPVTAVLDGDQFQVFATDPSGSVYTARGNSHAGWSPWQSISEGQTKPGTPVTAVLDGDQFQVFATDPSGSVYTARGNSHAGWSPWQSISEGQAHPGTPVTAVLDGDQFQVFATDPSGGVYTARGNGHAGWSPWQSVSDGRTKPGTPVCAVGAFQLFLSDPGGGIYAATHLQGGWSGWESVSAGVTAPGTPVCAVAVDNGVFRLFISDPAGEVFTAAGDHWNGWSPWRTVSQGTAHPGTQVAAVRDSDGFFAVFASDPAGGIYTVTNRAAPTAPRNLRVLSVAGTSVTLAWDDTSDDEDGFRISYHGRRPGSGDEQGTQDVNANTTSATLSELLFDWDYTITVAAFNAAGSSSESNAVQVTPRDVPHDVSLWLERQTILEGPIPYAGSYSGAQPGRLLSISAPPSNQVLVIRFVKVGHSSDEANDNPDSVVAVAQGQTTTPAQMQEIFGVAQPPYSSQQPLGIVAVVGQSDNQLLQRWR